MIAHNLAWKLALVVKGQSNDPEKLLDSYSAEVPSHENDLTIAHSDY
jgi:hypothetical protein